jgi:hypothetical protein
VERWRRPDSSPRRSSICGALSSTVPARHLPGRGRLHNTARLVAFATINTGSALSASMSIRRSILDGECDPAVLATHRDHPRSPRTYTQLLLGGVFQVLRYDNLKAAVRKFFEAIAARRDHTLHRLPPHGRFQSEFCTPEEPHEKGGIEGEAGHFRRNHWVPLTNARELTELNALLVVACRED